MPTRIPTRLLLLTAFGVTLVTVGVSTSTSRAADPFVAGQRSTRALELAADAADTTLARAARLSRALGLPGVSRSVERLDDRFDHVVYDEVVGRDRAGRPVSVARFRADGRLVIAAALGWTGGQAASIGRDAAARRAAEVARLAGSPIAGRPALARLSSGWSARWPRAEAGVPVLGDGVRILLWPDGSFHGLAVSERPLASTPGHRITPAQARRVAARVAASRYGAGAVSFDAASLAWVAPNDAWDAAAADAPAATLRLAWVVTLNANAEAAERVRALQVWVDAGDGSVIGGDVLE